MATFTIFSGEEAIVAWDCESGAQSVLSAGRFRGARALLPESEQLSFELTGAGPGAEYAIRIGEMWASDFLPEGIRPEGNVYRGRVFWAEYCWFESARGETPISLFVRSAGSGELTPLFTGTVFVVPSKLGEDRYETMSADLATLSRSLLSDLHGKSRRTYDLRHSRIPARLPSKEEELQAIGRLCPALEALVSAIGKHPSFRFRRIRRTVRFDGRKPVSPGTLARIAANHPEIGRQATGVNVADWVKTESFDIAEHRFLKAFLEFVRARARTCADAARRHIDAIGSDRPWRDVAPAGGANRRTLYEIQDVPAIARLEEAVRAAGSAEDSIGRMLRSQLLRRAKAEFVPVRGGMFSRSPEYRELASVMLRYLQSHSHRVDGGSFSGIAKLTSTLYEQWCFLRIVNALRDAGVELTAWNMEDAARGRFTIDFSRGLQFEGEITPSLHLRVTYQPWIHNLETASRRNSPLYRGGQDAASWAPDIVLEICAAREDGPVPVYVVVLDSKYSQRVRDEHWQKTSKYLRIRATHSGKQICRQLWLIAPLSAGPAIRPRDEQIAFDASGPTMEADETQEFTLAAVPDPDSSDAAFATFARGMVEYFKSRLSTQ